MHKKNKAHSILINFSKVLVLMKSNLKLQPKIMKQENKKLRILVQSFQ